MCALLTFLLVPSWWGSAGLTACAVSSTLPDVPFFLQVAREQEDFDDWVPTSALHASGSLAAQLIAGRAATQQRKGPFPNSGSLLVATGRPGEDTGVFSAQQVLDGLPHVPAEDAVPVASGPQHHDVLLLGVAFDQKLVRLPIGAVDAEVASWAGLEEEPYHVHWMTSPFAGLAFEGHPVDRCVACRPAAFKGRRPEACGLFLDGRALGRGICYRSSHTCFLEDGDLLRLLDVDLPAGLSLRLSGAVEISASGVFRFVDGASVVLWAVPNDDEATPAVADTAGTRSVGSSDAELSQVTPDERHDSASSRSRSPRGGPTQNFDVPNRGPEGSAEEHDAFDTVPIVAGEGTKWKRCSLQQACLPCANSDTSGTSPAFEIDSDAGSNFFEATNKQLSREQPSSAVSLPVLDTALLPEAGRLSLTSLLALELDAKPGTAALQSSAAILREAFLDSTKTAWGADSASTKSTISLSRHIPAPCFDLSLQQFPVGRTADEVFALLNCSPFHLACGIPDELRLHKATADMLLQLELTFCPVWAADRVDVYTDGSFDGQNSAWSCVVVCRQGKKAASVAWAGDVVCIDKESPKWIGASSHGALQAETSAITMFLWWACSAGLPASTYIHSDCLCALKRSEGAWHFAAEDKLACTCRCMHQVAQEIGVVYWENFAHVKGHSGEAWNELADGLAKFVLAKNSNLPIAGDIGQWVRSGDIDHLWLLVAASTDPLLWPRHVGSSMSDVHVVLGETEISLCPGIASQPLQRGGHSKPKSWHCLKIASLNVQTLSPDPGEPFQHFEGRIGYLREQFELTGAHVVALQETRTSRAECYLSGNFVRLCSGATAHGQLGVEVWFARRRSACSVGFLPDELTVVFWDPRCLCVRVKSQCLKAVVVAIHAPTAQDASREQWWCALAKRLMRLCAGAPVCVIGDFNVRFDKEVPARVGVHVWPSRYTVPSATYQILTEHDLWLPATFEGLHTGQHETWIAPGGTAAARLDYVAVPSTWYVRPGGSRVQLDIDPGHTSIDHFAVALEVWLRAPGDRTGFGTIPSLDRQKMSTPEGQSTIRHLCDTAPLLPWDLDADSHFAALQSHLFQGLTAHFPRPRYNKPGSFLSEGTWVLRSHRSWLRKQTARLRRRARLLDVLVAFCVWRDGVTWGVAWTKGTVGLCKDFLASKDFVDQLRSTKKELRQSYSRRQEAVDAPACARCQGSTGQGCAAPAASPPGLGRRKAYKRAVAAVELENGELAASAEEAEDRWVRHFSAIEGGLVCTEAAMLQEHRRRNSLCLGDSPEIAHGEIPSRIELERAFQATACHKACGPDGLPGELLKYGHGNLSKAVFQLVLKLAVRREEPLVCKGGIQYHVWKSKGRPVSVRTIGGFLSSRQLPPPCRSEVSPSIL